MADGSNAYDNVLADELDEARRYRMEIEWSPEDEVFVVSFPDAPGVMTNGTTFEDAAAQGKDAIITWLTAHRDAGLPVPPPAITARNAPTPPTIPQYRPEQIREIRRELDVSQSVFAGVLNVSTGAVRSWEPGVRQPEGAAMRLLDLVGKHPEILVEFIRPERASRDRPRSRSRRTKTARTRAHHIGCVAT